MSITPQGGAGGTRHVLTLLSLPPREATSMTGKLAPQLGEGSGGAEWEPVGVGEREKRVFVTCCANSV